MGDSESAVVVNCGLSEDLPRKLHWRRT